MTEPHSESATSDRGFRQLLDRATNSTRTAFRFTARLPHHAVFEPRFHALGLAEDGGGNRWVIRLNQPNLLAGRDSKLTNEFEHLGFFECGGGYRLRQPREQLAFHAGCRNRGLRVPAMIYADEGGDLVEFVPGDDLAVALAGDRAPDLVGRFLASLKHAHELNVLFGDRHCSNARVDPTGHICHLDVDVELSGRFAREFEIAQATFYALWASKDMSAAATVALCLLREWATMYDLDRIAHFLVKFCLFKNANYANGKYAPVLPIVTEVATRLVGNA